MGNTVLYIVKSWIPQKYAEEFNAWYHSTHIPQAVEASGCVSARRFRAVQTHDKFIFMSIYEFPDMETFLRYENSEAKKELVADFRRRYGDKAETKKYIWEQIHQ